MIEPPYVAVIFTSIRTEADAEGYERAADRMDELAREQPGFLGIESARGEDGTGITVSYWATHADALGWKRHAEHAAAQRLGRSTWYRHYRVRVAEVRREYSYDSEHGTSESGDTRG